MLKRKLTFAAFGLAACLCWALARTVADQPSRDIKNASDTTVSLSPSNANARAGGQQVQPTPTQVGGPAEIRESQHYTGERGLEEPGLLRAEPAFPAVETEGGTRSEPAACAITPCDIVIYDNQNVNENAGFSFGGRPIHEIGDDVNLARDERFVCSIRVGVGGINNSLGHVPLTVQIRSGRTAPDCPASTNSVVLFEGTSDLFLTNPFRFVTYVLPTPVLVDSDFVWIVEKTPATPATDASAGIVGPAEVGSSTDRFYIPNGLGTCTGVFFFFGGNPAANFDFRIRANTGPPGACCDRDSGLTGSCSTGLIRQDCLSPGGVRDLQNVWRLPNDCLTAFPAGPNGCNHCISDAEVCTILGTDPGGVGSVTLEGEPDCFAGYVDTNNDGCTSSVAACAGGGSGNCFKAITCPAVVCGSAGRYKHQCASTNDCAAGVTCAQDGAGQPFYCHGADDDDADDDWYQFVLASEQKVTITLTARFNAHLLLMNNGGDPNTCNQTIYADAIGVACDTITVTKCLPEGTWRILVLTDAPKIPCGTKYHMTLACSACDSPLVRVACCDGSPCHDLDSDSCVGRGGLPVLSPANSTCAANGGACPLTPANDDCISAQVVTGQSVVVSFDTTFAHASPLTTDPIDQCRWEPAPPAAGVPIFRDVFFDYIIPTSYNGTAITNARLVLGTKGSSFDTYMVVYGDTGASQVCGSNLCSKPQIACSQNIVPNPPWPAQIRNRVSHIELTVGGTGNVKVGDCILIRYGSPNSGLAGRGPALLNIDVVPTSTPFTAETGRCCHSDGTCTIEIDFSACNSTGGSAMQQVDYYKGVNPLPNTNTIEEYAGCNANGCPQPGEAGYNAMNLNLDPADGPLPVSHIPPLPPLPSRLFVSSDYGTTTRAITDQANYEYIVRSGVGGIVIDSCGSSIDAELVVYRRPSGGSNPQSVGCPILCGLGTKIKLNDTCTLTESTADGALQTSSCYSGLNGTFDACLCLSVPGDVAIGDHLIIVEGRSIVQGIKANGSTRDTIDPVPDDTTNFIVAQTSSLTVTGVAQCFVCPSVCTTGLPEGEPIQDAQTSVCSDINQAWPNDDWDGGCDSAPPAFQGPLLDLGTGTKRVCGHAGNFKHPAACQTNAQCANTCVNNCCANDTLFTDRDRDWYKVIVPQPGVLSWKIISTQFQTDLFIVADPPIITDPTASPCNATQLTTLAFGEQTFACTPPTGTAEALEITASVCAGTYYLVITPAVFGGLGETAPSAAYEVETSLAPFVQETSCCKGDVNTDGKINGLDIQKWVNLVFTPPTTFDKFRGCFAPNFCRADINGDGLINFSDVSGFVNLLVTSTKPTCPDTGNCLDAARGQLPDQLSVSASDSDSNSLTRSADSFIPTANGTLNHVCWWGTYLTNAGVNATADLDCFVITLYSSGGSGQPCPARVPGADLVPLAPGSSEAVVVTRTATGNAIGGSFTEFQYEANLPTPIALNKGVCYWIEITNRTPGGTENDSVWNWETSLNGDTRAAKHSNATTFPTTYTCPDDIIHTDLAFVLDFVENHSPSDQLRVGVDKEGCGKPAGRCCFGLNNSCATSTEEVCTFISHGQWSENGTCGPANPVCPVGRCCYLSGNNTLCAVTVQASCIAVGGRWQSGGDCTGNPACPTGRCCVPDPNNAGVIICTPGLTEVQCVSQGGAWLQGGDCLTPCPTAICNLNSGPDRCQVRDKVGGYASDVDKGSIIAEDFRTSGFSNLSVSQLCWRGIHRTPNPTFSDCDSGTTETFDITYYNNSGGLPGTVKAGPFSVVPLRTDSGEVTNPDGISTTPIPIYTYETFHSPVAVSTAQCYWIEIKQTNGNTGCTFFWATSSDGNKRAAIKLGANPYRQIERDFAICMGPVTIVTPPPSPCGATNPAPTNDTCAGIINIVTGVTITGTTLGATIEGGSQSCATTNNGSTPGDVWYHLDNTNSPTNNSKLDAITCGAPTTFPAALSLTVGVAPTFTPPCPGVAANEVGGVLNPACAPKNTEPNPCLAQDLVYMGLPLPGQLKNVAVVNNRGYTLRIAGNGGSRGDFQLLVTKHP